MREHRIAGAGRSATGMRTNLVTIGRVPPGVSCTTAKRNGTST